MQNQRQDSKTIATRLINTLDQLKNATFTANPHRCLAIATRGITLGKAALSAAIDASVAKAPTQKKKKLIFSSDIQLVAVLQDCVDLLHYYSKLDQLLAARIIKNGADVEEFIKLNERINDVYFELEIVNPNDLAAALQTDNQDLLADISHLKSNLGRFLIVLGIQDPVKFNSLLAKTVTLIDAQFTAKQSFHRVIPITGDIQINEGDLVKGDLIGQGGFGSVYKGKSCFH